MILKLNLLDLNFFYRHRFHVEVVSTTVRHLSDLQFPGYRTKYVENVVKGSPGRVFMVLIHRLNVNLRP